MSREGSKRSRGRWSWLALSLLSAAACGEGAVEPDPDPGPGPDPTIASVEVASPIDTLLAVAWSTQFEATARDADGGTMSASFEWHSSAPDVASVSGTGQVTPHAVGTTVISATASDVTGTLRIGVLQAEVDAALDVLEDPLVDHLVGGLGASGPTAQAALTGCLDGLAAGNLVAAGECLDALRAAAAGASDGEERVLLAVTLLMSDHAARLLTL